MAQDAAERFTARELAALCELSERTVRYYVEEGLLPPPAGRGRGAHFEAAHLTRLRLIRAMQRAGNDLETIGEYLRELERASTGRRASFESALALWSARTEEAAWRERLGALGAPQTLHRYRIAEGVELLVEARSAPAASRMREVLRLLRAALADED